MIRTPVKAAPIPGVVLFRRLLPLGSVDKVPQRHSEEREARRGNLYFHRRAEIAPTAIATIFLAVFCSIIYFFFVKEYKGAFATASRCGPWIPMALLFGAGRGSYHADRFVLEINARQGVI